MQTHRCIQVCPVDCFPEGPNFLVIDPNSCVDCGLCEVECPVDAIRAEAELAPEQSISYRSTELSQNWPRLTERKAGIARSGRMGKT